VGQWSVELDARWRALAEEVIVGMKEWRLRHPKATLREIETALDEGLAKVRARFLEDAALASAAADVSQAQAEERPRCRRCGQSLEARGQETREVTTMGNQTVRLTRSYAVCPSCGEGLFPPG
jgi:YgiT-type zinc finger domain-containing protein